MPQCQLCLSNEEMASHLLWSGFVEYKGATVVTEPFQYSGNLDSPVKINITIAGKTVPLTEELNWFLGAASAYGVAQAKVAVFNGPNCSSFTSYSVLLSTSNVYTD
jgi:hypothetical protein